MVELEGEILMKSKGNPLKNVEEESLPPETEERAMGNIKLH